jgi:hypothetical protein
VEADPAADVLAVAVADGPAVADPVVAGPVVDLAAAGPAVVAAAAANNEFGIKNKKGSGFPEPFFICRIPLN